MTHLLTYRHTPSTHMCGKHIASMSSQSCSNMAPSTRRPTHMHGSPRICVESYLNHVSSHVLKKQTRPRLASPSQSHAYAQDSTHMCGRQASSQRFQGHAHASKQDICVEEEFSPVQDKMTHA
ncbi:hypothetical protein PIB30_102581 [Stylosanthes scabra]|uniref:Uncharacterized protein n=1 Tax=Stylosanthes scabra TaxID=79078 RepID=A0ABU6RXM4_9FABA|nr:hypothetical protein [Stylosanthes scabra]